VFVLNRLSEEELYQIAARALRLWRSDDQDDGGKIETEDKAALLQLAQVSDGDGKCSAVKRDNSVGLDSSDQWIATARTALNILDIALSVLPSPSSPLTTDGVKGQCDVLS
jgi:putative ATPase